MTPYGNRVSGWLSLVIPGLFERLGDLIAIRFAASEPQGGQRQHVAATLPEARCIRLYR